MKNLSPDIPYWPDGRTTTLNIYAQVELLTLVGVIAKNGIFIMEFANHLPEHLTKWTAIKEASMTRLCPVFMTSIARVAGHFPLTLIEGAGAPRLVAELA